MSPSSPNVKEQLSHDSTGVVPAWKKELNERLAVARSRRVRTVEEQVPLPGLGEIERKVESRASRLAAKVAQRYANAPSYSDVLAAERVRLEATSAALPLGAAHLATESCDVPSMSESVISSYSVAAEPQPVTDEAPEPAEMEPVAGNVIDFPRELVAARKLRPRLAEGPLLVNAHTEQDQLKIKVEAATADWAAIRLDDHRQSDQEPVLAQELPFKTAPLEDRLMAGIFDLALVVAAFAIFALVFVACTAHPPTGKAALIGAGLVLAGFFLLYQYLFFKFSVGTPGMRYAKIALCTFEDENPTRSAMCRRVWFLLLSAAPLGLGFAWAWFDPDRLSWHDRLSRIYQRSYS